MNTVVRRADAGRFDPVAGRVLVATEEPYPRRVSGIGRLPAGTEDCDNLHCHQRRGCPPLPAAVRAVSPGDRASASAQTDLRAEPDERVVVTPDHALLHRDDRVVGDPDVLGADLRAALRDVAHPDALLVAGEVRTVLARVERVHLELGGPDEEARPREGLLVVLVVAHDVARVLAEEALDALAELLG